ncbi:prenyltransferase/squalene oxidase repeat-containing protein [Streptomyces sp. CB02460]|uniref:prenyltransferase/squalene oxidase repeat-containing protein n=1 Tax=Streptomyces sp. CB02460 TaxID=1703941 RepID=UPI00093F0F42|nr:prenyltransferase/squalene oxidase repeat-containing protein [Streptomyces sp. CB02460]OKJ73201.1 peptidase [Streptomyces sp. CB02460]
MVTAVLCALGLLAAACFAFLPGAPRAAAAPVGDCTATKGAVVAVDFGPFGGTVERGCDTTPTTGYDLLHEGGFTTAGTQHDGPAFICRIGYGAFNSGTQYPTPGKEACVLTPQATAYWSYWVASAGQDDWSYSQYGAMGRKLKDGDVDAWVYGGTDIGGTTGRPAFSPDDVRAAGGSNPDPGGEPTGAPGRVDVAGAASWLKDGLTDGERIVDEGAETPNYLLTTETAYALAAADGRSDTLDKVTSFLAGHVDDYVAPNGKDQPPATGAAARLALLAESTEGDARSFGGRDLIADLTGNVCTERAPGNGCTAAGDIRDITYADEQARAVLALLRAGEKPHTASVERLAQVQCKDGGITSILIQPGERCEGDAGTTGLIALVLHTAGGHEPAVAKARDYLAKTQLDTGAFPGYAGSTTGDVIATAYAAQTLRALGATKRADAAEGWLSRVQLKDGGFGFDQDAVDPTLYATPVAVLAGARTDLATLTTEKSEPTAPPTATPPTTEAPAPGKGPDLKKGVAYLTGAAQLKQGRYYPVGPGSGRADFGLTIDGAYALAATGLNDAKLRGIVDFLDDRGKDGEGRTVNDWTGAGTAYAAGGSIGKTALLAEAVGRDPRDFAGHDLIAALDKAVCPAPSTAPDRSCAAEGAYTYAPSVFSQALAVMAQLRAGDKDNAQAPLAYLESLQNDGNGAWPSLIPPTGDSDVDSTAIAAMALDLAGGQTADAAVGKALKWIASKQLPDGGFPGAAGNSVNSAALAVQGLSLDKATYRKEIDAALTFLAGQQNGDGGFKVAKEGQPGSDLRASTQAVGGATGISFGKLDRGLDGTSAQPTPSDDTGGIPQIVTPGDDNSGSGGGIVDADGGDGGGALASTGVQVTALAAFAVLLTALGWWAVVAARRRVAAEAGR